MAPRTVCVPGPSVVVQHQNLEHPNPYLTYGLLDFNRFGLGIKKLAHQPHPPLPTGHREIGIVVHGTIVSPLSGAPR